MTRLSFKHVGLLGLTSILLMIYLYGHQTKRRETVEILTSRKLSEESSSYVKFIGDDVQLNGFIDQNNRFPVLKESQDEVPVAIVDEHNEVIPYWYKAVDEGIIEQYNNTLIHIDGHSDMANPENYHLLRKFQYVKNAHESAYLPLMQANDNFITSAISKGLISHVVWIIPSWSENSRYTMLHHAFVGVTTKKGTKEKTFCDCKQMVSKKYKKKLNWECVILNREAESIEEIEQEIPVETCKKLKSFTFITLGESKFIERVKLNNVKNLFIDIDEDYFGVESGVQKNIDAGVSLEMVVFLGEIFPQLFCPTSIAMEQKLNQIVKQFFKTVSTILTTDVQEKKEIVKSKLLGLLKPYFCDKQPLPDKVLTVTINGIANLSHKETLALSNSEYCLMNSPRLHVEMPQFHLCHGTIFPEDTLNQIYVGKTKEIDERARHVQKIIDYIYQNTQPRFLTIARSLRDGYTPRKQQRYIEKVLLENLDRSISKAGKRMKVIYDKELVFGKHGWF